MATIYNIAGTTSHSFTLGNGTTIFYGSLAPTDDMGNVGDIYVQLDKELTELETVADITAFPTTYQTEHGTALPAGYVIKYTGTTSSPYTEDTCYKWNGTTWVAIDDEQTRLGRLWYKEQFNNTKFSRWSFIKTYSFDSDIIDAKETELYSNDWKIKIESADRSSSSTSQQGTDYNINHTAYGVTRYAANSEAVASDIQNYKTYSSTSLPTNFNTSGQKFMDKFIALTPKQVADNIKVEMKRAITVEGTLNNLSDTPLDNTNLVTAIKAEFNRAFAAEDILNEKIEALIAKKDVVDIVQYYSKVEAGKTNLVDDVDKFELSYNDIVKVLTDETHNDKTVYYKLDIQPADAQKPDLKFLTKAELDAYNKQLLHNDDIAMVKTDSSHSNKTTYYKFNSSTNAWVYQNEVTETWTYVGEENAYYTISESDDRFVHLTGNETIAGTKTFNNNALAIKSTSIDETDTATAGYMHLGFFDKENTETGHLKSELTSDNKVITTVGAARTINNERVGTDLCVTIESNGTKYVTGPSPLASNDTSNNNKFTTVEWVNDPAKSTNVVHRTGNETITGTKTMTGATVTVKTQNAKDNSTKAASTAYVDGAVSTAIGTSTSSIPTLNDDNPSSSTKNKVLSNDGSAFYWKEVKDYTKLSQLEDVTITSATTGQSLIYDATLNSNAGGWKNGNPTVATITYY